LRSQLSFRLLVVRLGAMGDILHALPAITALRKAHPGWTIDWAVEPQWRPLLSAEKDGASAEAELCPTRPLVNRIFEVPAKAWSRRPLHASTLREILILRAKLRAISYDAVLDLQGSVRSGIVARFTGCTRIVGEAQPREAAAKWLFSERIETSGVHVIEQDLELVEAVAGDMLTYVAPALPEDPEAESWCSRLQEEIAAGQPGAPILLVHPGAGWGAKRWPPERYGAVAAEFVRRGGIALINAGLGEEDLAARVAADSRSQARIVRCSISQLIALTRHISLAIGGDTGPLHLASALGKPVIGIYGPTDPRRNGPYGSQFRVLRNPESRRDHARREAPEAGLLTIQPQAVLEAISELLPEWSRTQQQRKQPEIWDSIAAVQAIADGAAQTARRN
jgi:heptosyltransferase I